MALAIFGLGVAFFGLIIFSFLSVFVVKLLKLSISVVLHFYRRMHTA